MNRREALQAGAAILTAIKVDGEVSAMSPVNPQAFVITIPGRLTRDEQAAMRAQWKDVMAKTAFSELPVIILQNGMQLSVVDSIEENS